MAKRFINQVNFLPVIRLVIAGSLFIALIASGVFYNPKEIQIFETVHNFGGDEIIEKVKLRDGNLEVIRGNEVIFKSDENYEVNDFEIGDINNDGKEELIIGYLRSGDFGKNLPYIEFRRDPKKGYHLSFYQYSSETKSFKLIWGSSTLPHPIYDFEVEPQKDKNVLKVIEGSYEEYDQTEMITPKKTSYWIWNEWWLEEYLE